MTIKRQLFISNILMIVLPLILTIVMFSVIALAFFKITGLDHRFTGVDFVDIDRAGIILQEGNYVQVAADVSIYQLDEGGYIAVVPTELLDDWWWLNGAFERDEPLDALFTMLMLSILLIIVYLTNFTLTKRISNRIMTSIGILTNGVHEISSGNLTYRIKYNNNDEFDAVCTDFNEMANRLSDMVKQRQVDENSRKELIAGISHDLRTPLTSIKAYIEGLKKGVASTPQMQEKYLDTIQNKTEDIEYIISQLFLFSKMDIGEFPFNLETVDIGVELDKMIAEFTDEYKDRGLAVSLKETTQGVFVSVDIVQFRNVVQNILENTVKYGRKDNAHTEIFCRKSNNSKQISITIKDNGSGVSEEMLTKMFEVFYRGDISRNNPSQGSGLGLAISSKIIERLGGSITAENAKEGGLSVIITLPELSGQPERKEGIWAGKPEHLS